MSYYPGEFGPQPDSSDYLEGGDSPSRHDYDSATVIGDTVSDDDLVPQTVPGGIPPAAMPIIETSAEIDQPRADDRAADTEELIEVVVVPNPRSVRVPEVAQATPETSPSLPPTSTAVKAVGRAATTQRATVASGDGAGVQPPPVPGPDDDALPSTPERALDGVTADASTAETQAGSGDDGSGDGPPPQFPHGEFNERGPREPSPLGAAIGSHWVAQRIATENTIEALYDTEGGEGHPSATSPEDGAVEKAYALYVTDRLASPDVPVDPARLARDIVATEDIDRELEYNFPADQVLEAQLDPGREQYMRGIAYDVVIGTVMNRVDQWNRGGAGDMGAREFEQLLPAAREVAREHDVDVSAVWASREQGGEDLYALTVQRAYPDGPAAYVTAAMARAAEWGVTDARREFHNQRVLNPAQIQADGQVRLDMLNPNDDSLAMQEYVSRTASEGARYDFAVSQVLATIQDTAAASTRVAVETAWGPTAELLLDDNQRRWLGYLTPEERAAGQEYNLLSEQDSRRTAEARALAQNITRFLGHIAEAATVAPEEMAGFTNLLANYLTRAGQLSPTELLRVANGLDSLETVHRPVRTELDLMQTLARPIGELSEAERHTLDMGHYRLLTPPGYEPADGWYDEAAGAIAPGQALPNRMELNTVLQDLVRRQMRLAYPERFAGHLQDMQRVNYYLDPSDPRVGHFFRIDDMVHLIAAVYFGESSQAAILHELEEGPLGRTGGHNGEEERIRFIRSDIIAGPDTGRRTQARDYIREQIIRLGTNELVLVGAGGETFMADVGTIATFDERAGVPHADIPDGPAIRFGRMRIGVDMQPVMIRSYGANVDDDPMDVAEERSEGAAHVIGEWYGSWLLNRQRGGITQPRSLPLLGVARYNSVSNRTGQRTEHYAATYAYGEGIRTYEEILNDADGSQESIAMVATAMGETLAAVHNLGHSLGGLADPDGMAVGPDGQRYILTLDKITLMNSRASRDAGAAFESRIPDLVTAIGGFETWTAGMGDPHDAGRFRTALLNAYRQKTKWAADADIDEEFWDQVRTRLETSEEDYESDADGYGPDSRGDDYDGYGGYDDDF